MKRGTEFGLLVLLSLIPLTAFATDVPDADLFGEILKLLNLKNLGVVGAGLSIIVIAMQVLKKFLGDFPYKRVVVVVLGVAYGVFQSLAGGLGVVEALVAVLVSAGGAMKIYDAIVAEVKA
jgi:hypothetical protein